MVWVWPNRFFAKSKSQLESFLPKLKSEKTYILPTKFGFAFAFLCLILIYSSFATGNNLMYLYTFFLSSLGFTSLWLTHVNISDVRIERVEVEDSFADGRAHALVNIFNDSRRRRYFIHIYHIKAEGAEVEEMAPKSYRQVRIPLGEFARGIHPLPRITLDTTFPFSLLRSWKIYRGQEEFLVYPRREGESRLPFIETLNETEEGRTQDRVRSPDSEFSGHRRFEESDSIRHVDWKAFARTERMLVKDYQGFRPREVKINFSQTSMLTNFEKKLSQLAQWIEIAESKGLTYSFRMGAHQFGSDRGRAHYCKCLRALAEARPEDFA